MKHFKLLLVISALSWFSTAFADENFIVKNIRIKGSQRVSEATVLSYLPIKHGGQLTAEMSDKIIDQLYATGFFSNVSLSRSGATLLVAVDERPIIGKLEIIGNKKLPKNKLDEAIKKMGIAQGEVFSNALLKQLQQILINQYYSMGYYNVAVTTLLKHEDRNRVSIVINIAEGMIARVMKITLIGNKAFDANTLLATMPLTGPKLWNFLTNRDQYSKSKLDDSTEAVKDYYLNHGYLDIRVDSTQVTITADKKSVYLVLHITEGQPYKFSGFKLTGRLLDQTATLTKAISIKAGNLFSRQRVVNSTTAMTTQLGNLGYAFARVKSTSTTNKVNHTVFISFNIQPGNRYYIRRINFVGNSLTSNFVLRNNLMQFSGGLYSTSKINESIRNLRNLAYLEPDQIAITPVAVPGSNNQLDLVVQVTERLFLSSVNAHIGYKYGSGIIFDVGVEQKNILGTGKTAGISYYHSSAQTSYSLNYFNPFFTPNGIGYRAKVFYENVKPPRSKGKDTGKDIAEFTSSAAGLTGSFSFPISNYQFFYLGYGLQRAKLALNDEDTNISTEVKAFTEKFGTEFYQILATAGWNYDTRDRAIFPTSGNNQSLDLTVSLPVSKTKSLEYYTVTYETQFYQPLTAGFVLNTEAVIGYGAGYGRSSVLPFLFNFVAGGVGQRGQNRAYWPDSLGPQNSKQNAFGGNLLTSASVSLIFPSPLTKYNVRTSVFVDAGNVFNAYGKLTDENKSLLPGDSNTPKLNNLRYSVGLQLVWLTPLGIPITFSYAKPLKKHAGDTNIQAFQLNLGFAS